tara:strand:- start:45200 stop:45916 length:717 start_codon:yes stop_codon:yes gene_type:complete
MNRVPVLASALAVFSVAGALALAQPEGEGQVNRRVQVQVDRMMANDKNNDGKLSRDELPERLAERLFATSDTDGDGLISREELIAGFAGARGGGAQPGQAGQPGRAAPAEAGADRSAHDLFEGGMKQAGGAMRTLRRSGFEPGTRDSDLDAIQSLQEGMITAKNTYKAMSMSEQAKAKYGDDTDAYHRDFRLGLVSSLQAALALEAAVLREDAAGAKESLAWLLNEQGASHDLFQNEE